MLQRFGAGQIGLTRARERAQGPVSPVRRCRMRWSESSKSYKRHSPAQKELKVERNRRGRTNTSLSYTQSVSLLVASYLIFLHPLQYTAPPPPLCSSAPDRLAVCRCASDNRGSCCHSRFLGARPCEAARKVRGPLAAADLRAATPPTATTTQFISGIS